MAQRIYQIMPRLFAALILVNLALLMGCGGTAGVDNGRVVGKVFANLRDRSATRLPEPGVSVVAQREGATPPLIRTTVTDANGNYTFADLPTGAYVIGFAKEGFLTIDTQSGATSQRTAVGSQVRVFIDSGRTSNSPDVTMIALQPSGDAIVIVTVRDQITGAPVTDAVVTAGPVTQLKNVNGVYTLTVPILRRNDTSPFGSGEITIPIGVRAEGFKPFAEPTVRVLPGETTRFLVNLQPLGNGDQGAIKVQGTYRFSNFQNLLGLTDNIKLSVRNVADGLLNPINGRIVQLSGTFFIDNLPPSTATIIRRFDFIFEHPNIETFTLRDQAMPRTGTITIADPVVLNPIVVDVFGTVTLSPDAGVTVEVPANSPKSFAQILETGQQATINGGTFLITKVPVRQIDNDAPWNLRIFAERQSTGAIFKTAADTEIRPLRNGSSADPFDVGLLQANQLAGQ